MNRVVVVDNYDSFTYNLVQYIGELGADVIVHRHDAVTPEQIEREQPTHVVISPGPKTPTEAGISVDVVRHFAGRLPILGVCLGHQAIAAAYGGEIVRGREPVHGKVSDISHDGRTVFAGIADPMPATRYHSLVVQEPLPDELEVSARCDGDVVMGLRHRELAIEGVQFHPESILTDAGKDLLANFLQMTAEGS